MPKVLTNGYCDMHVTVCGHCKSAILFGDDDVRNVFLKRLGISWNEITCPNCGQHVTIGDDCEKDS